MTARIRLLTLVLGLFTALAVVAPASSATCADRLIDDWADNAEIDGTYPIECYRAAIQALPEDLRAYSSAADDIRRAQQEQIAAQSGGQASSGQDDAAPQDGADQDGGDTAGEGTNAEEREPQGSTQQDTLAGVPSDGGPGDDDGVGDASGGGSETVAAPASDLFDREVGDGGSSLPVPIVVLLAIAGLAAVAVAGWLLSRQYRGRPPAGS